MAYLDNTGLGTLWGRIKAYIASLGYTSNVGTVTGVKMNNGSAISPVNGVVDLGTVVTSAPVTSVNGQTGAVSLSIPSAPGTLNTTATTAQSTSGSEALSGNVTLHKVAKTGTYDDLIGKPTIPTVPEISTDIISDGIDDTKTASPKAVKAFVEGKHYLTSETEPDFNGSAAASITSDNITAWNGKQDALVFNTAYNASSNKVATMSDIPTVPSNVSAFTNDAGYTTNTGTVTSTGGTVAVNNIQVVSALPASPDANTLYLITGS